MGDTGLMYRVILRAKKDLHAFMNMVKKYYSDWPIEVLSLGGIRDIDEILREVNKLSSDKYNFVLLGLRDVSSNNMLKALHGGTTIVRVIGKARIRNTRLEELAWEFEVSRAFQRLLISYINGKYVLGESSNLIISKPQPYNDLFILYINEDISKIIGIEHGSYLVLRSLGGKHYFFREGRITGSIVFSEDLSIPRYYGDYPEKIHIDELVYHNKRFLETEERIVLNFMEKFRNEYDYYIVPWSGGKDSTTALYLALKTYGSKRVYAVYVHLDTDLPVNIEFIEEAAKRMGIKNLVVVRNSLKKYLPVHGYPTHDNRWCTGVKIESLKKVYGELCGKGSCLIVSGDRDVESEKRSNRSPVQVESINGISYYKITPLKQWSTLTLQLYMYLRHIPINPLYTKGFYRLGCYICPSLRNWEILLLKTLNEFKDVREDTVFQGFLSFRKTSVESRVLQE